MSATPQVTTSPEALPAVTSAEIDLSCRWPVLFLAAKSAGWLFLASVFGLLASVKFHGPAFLADSAWLTYGRVYPAATNMFLYGFALQAALAVGLWLLCRICRTKLAGAGVVIAGTTLWNLGVFWAVLHILAGNSSGFEGMELPLSALELLLVAWVSIGAAGLLTFSRRSEQQLYASAWFVVTALFVFPWIASTACLLLHVAPVRGTVQALVAWWFVANLHWLVLGFIALAVIFFFVPKLSGKPLHSHYSALFTFWLVLLFGPWVGVPSSAPVPAWLPALSAVMSAFLVLPAIATATNIWRTLFSHGREASRKPSLRFVVVAAFAFALALVMQAVQSVRPMSGVLQFTLFLAAQKQVILYGFVGMALLGALHAILPRVTARELPSRGMASLTFGVMFAAVVIWSVSLALGGIQQGKLLADGNAAFTDIVSKILPFLRFSTFADLAMVVASFAFCWNATGLLCHACRAGCAAALCERAAVVEAAPKGVRA